MSWKPAGSTATQTPTPARHVPPACGAQRGYRAQGSAPGTPPGTGDALASAGVPSLGLGSPPPTPSQSGMSPRGRTHKHQDVEDEHQVLHTAQDTHGDAGVGVTAASVPVERRAEPWPQPAPTCPGPPRRRRDTGASTQLPQIPRASPTPHHLPLHPQGAPSPGSPPNPATTHPAPPTRPGSASLTPGRLENPPPSRASSPPRNPFPRRGHE